MIDVCQKALGDGKAWFGIEILKTDFEKSDQTGVTVLKVKPTGPAEVAGIQTKDIIELINSEPTRRCLDFGVALGKLKPGDVALVQGRRGTNQRFSARVEIGTKDLTYKNVKQAQRIIAGTIMIGDEEFIIYLMKKQQDN